MRQSVAIASFSFALFLGWPAPTVLAQIAWDLQRFSDGDPRKQVSAGAPSSQQQA